MDVSNIYLCSYITETPIMSKETTPGSSTASSQKPTLQLMKRISSKSSSIENSTLSEVENSKKSDPEVPEQQRLPPKQPPGTVPRTSRPTSARNLSSMLGETKMSSDASNASGSSSSSDGKDDVLQNVKFKKETLSTMQNKKNQLVKRASIEKKEAHLEHLVGQPLSR